MPPGSVRSMSGGTWSWRLENAAGETVPIPSTGIEGFAAAANAFPTQSDAESWVGEEWQDLLAEGVVAVFLYEDDRFVYGPMSLLPAD